MVRIIDVDATFAQVVANVRRRFAGFVDREDLESEGTLWMLEHPNKMREYLCDDDIKRADYRLRRDLTMCLERLARSEKAQQLGYDPEDEQYFNAALVAALLPAIVEGVYTPARPLSDAPPGRSDPAEGGVWTAARADVSRAWERADLSGRTRAVLVDYYVEGYTEQEIADALECDRSTVSRILKRGMRRIIKELGGEKPRGCPYDCECHDAPLRIRPGIRSNTSGMNQYFE